VFTKLRQANLVLNPEKCHFTRFKVELLGHIVSCDGLQVNPDKVKKLVEMRLPRNTSEVRSFLGLASYYRRFVKDFAKIAHPIIKMTGKDVHIVWDKPAQISFNTLKEALTTAPVLAYPNPKKPFILTTDASSLALSAILFQEDDFKIELVIAYTSQTLNQAQASYSATHLEALPIIWAVNKFRHYLYGREFKLRTDHSALVSILKSIKPLTGMLARWAAFLQEYKFQPEHWKGKDNPADPLSRLVDAVEEPVQDHILIRKYLETDELPSNPAVRKRIQWKSVDYSLQDGSLWCKKNKQQCKVLETSGEHQQALTQLHDERGHPGINNTTAALNRRFW